MKDAAYLDPETINGLNLYAYCLNNPVMGCDPSGTFVIPTIVIGLIIGAIARAAVGGTIAGITASNNGATGWELFGWTMLGIVGGGIIGGAIGALIGAVAPMIGSFLGTPIFTSSFALAGGGTVTVSVTAGEALALTGAIVLFARSSNKNNHGAPNSFTSNGFSDRIYDENGNLIYRRDYNASKPHYIKGFGYCSPHTHQFVWKLIDGVWRIIKEIILPF